MVLDLITSVLSMKAGHGARPNYVCLIYEGWSWD